MIKIHGLPTGRGFIGRQYLCRDWADGGIAVTDGEVGEPCRSVAHNAGINIKP
ncbi:MULTISPECIES: hypothetical protein [unclassified Neisseria]|uniref:hypothetical protein n=1 Tax=unclassified Neisseria TaxID=2623750 RepID=UPI002665B696|nr:MULTISPECIES: hypothetical protein [unclassified Neisseria]MDO1509760.1 hypothetical protein [Neisseria sp. MVDL19-042950]MDO1515916.1 hypothetical protein [Neisseria sp. MVDL18-041461]MDO1563029.1 hypothetical protein [Neisseria sp. MVDL20-010259]